MTLIGRPRAIHQRALRALLWLNLLLLAAGCATKQPKENPPARRGWVGGQYRLAEKPRQLGTKGAIEAFPGAVADQKTGVLVTVLSSNTPAALAGLREGDLILEINHAPVQRL